MKLRGSLTSVVPVVVFCIFLLSDSAFAFRGTGEKQQKIISNVRKRPSKEMVAEWGRFNQRYKGTWRIRFNPATGIPEAILGDKTFPMKGSPKEVAKNFINQNRKILSVDVNQLKLDKVTLRKKWTHINFFQTYKGIPVEGGRLVVHMTKKNEIAGINSRFKPDIDLSVIPTLPQAQAIEIVRNNINNRPHPERKSSVTLVIFPNEEDGKYYLAWKVNFFVPDPPADWIYFVDAKSGRIIFRYDNLRHSTSGVVQGMIFPSVGSDTLRAVPFFQQYVTISDPDTTILFYDDMESGIGGWTTVDYSGGGDLWHQTTSHINVSTSCHSPTTSWWCGIDSQGNYANGNTITNGLISPSIDLTSYERATITFWEYYETEIGYDLVNVDISIDGGSSWNSLRSGETGSSGGWIQNNFDISSYVGYSVLIRFYFDTQDEAFNDYNGWFIEDVKVVGAVSPTIVVTTNDDGSYNNPSTGSVSSSLRGPWVKVINEDGTEASYPVSPSDSPAPSWTWNYTSTDTHIDEVNVFYHVNQVRRYYKHYLDFSGMDYEMTARVHVGKNFANAYYAPYDKSINFGDGNYKIQGGKFREFSRSADIIYHEYTHGVQDMVYDKPYYGQSGAIEEAFSDYYAGTITDDPITGEWTMPDEYVRDMSKLYKFPDDWVGQVHDDSRIYSGAMWDVRQAIGKSIADEVLFESLFFQPGDFVSGLEAILMADDDDSNLSNGTPHKTQIETAFAKHGIAYRITTANDNYEPNDGFSNAYGFLSSGTTYYSYISTKGDKDYYKIQVGTGNLNIKLDMPESVDYDLILFDGNKDGVAGSAAYGLGIDEEINYFASNGLYYIWVNPYEGFSSVDSYSLCATFSPFAKDTTPPVGMPSTPTVRGLYGSSTVVFCWTQGNVSDLESGIDGYYLQVGKTPGGNDAFDGYVGNVLFKEVSSLSHGTTYYAQVRARNNAGLYSAYSGISTGIYIDITPPTGAPLGFGARWLDANTIEFYWTKGNLADPDSGIAGYHLEVRTGRGESDIFNDYIGNVLSQKIYNLDEKRVYFAKLKAINGAGLSTDYIFVATAKYATNNVLCWDNVFKPLKGETAKITYHSTKSGHISIKIYDLVGRKIRTIMDKDVSAGFGDTVEWAGLNDRSDLVASGLYFVHIEGPGFSKTGKIILVK